MFNWRAKLFKLSLRFPFISKIIKVNDGFIEEPLKDDDWVFGASPLIKKVLQPDGQWTKFLPEDEKQQGYRVETMACTVFSFLNVLEMLAKRKEFGDWNKSDRFTAKLSGVSYNGNTQSRVMDSVRKLYGTVDEWVWPSNIDIFNWSQFYSVIPSDIQAKGFTFLNDYEVRYEAILTNASALKEGLKYSPIYLAGYAWAESLGLYRSWGNSNHAFTLVGYVDGSHWLAYDSYSPYLKKLAWNYQFYYPKLITLDKRGEQYNVNEVRKLIQRGWKYIIRAKSSGQIYELKTEGLKYISPQEWNKIAVQYASEQKILEGINEIDFNRLLS